LHEVTLLVSIETTDAPSTKPAERAVVECVGEGIWQVHLRFGFIDDPDVPKELSRLRLDGERITVADLTYFLGRETVVSTPIRTMNSIREHIFVLQNRTAASAARFFNLPADRVFEVGTTIEI
jgi:KUP system potassium uptake protein